MKKTAIAVCLLTILGFLYAQYLSSGPAIRNATPTGENIICFGDSLTYGTGASEGMDYPSRLSEMIGKPVVNAGVPGDTTSLALLRLEADVLAQSPRIVLITLGGNDLKNGISRDVAFRNLKEIVTAIQERGALVVIGGIDIPFWGRGFGEEYVQLAEETGSVLIPNIFKGVIGKSELMNDSIHPNDAGYAVFAGRFYEAVKPYLNQ